MYYVYEHLRNDTNEVFYVGKGKDYRAYLKWLDEGNQPLPPDEGV